MANERKTSKGTRASANPEPMRWSANDLDQLATAVAVALGACADCIAALGRDGTLGSPSEELEERLTFLRQLSQEVSRLGIPF